MISVTVDDHHSARDIQQLGDTQGWRVPMTQSLALLVDDIATYPPPPADSSYQRTGNLGRLWATAQYEIHADTGGITGVIGNAVRDRRGRAYGPYVQDEDEQAEVHRGRWPTDAQVAARNTGAITRIWGDWVEKQI